MKTIDKNAIGVLLGFGAALLCIVLAAVMHVVHPYLPAAREFLLWVLGDVRFAMGMTFGCIMGLAIVLACLWSDR